MISVANFEQGIAPPAAEPEARAKADVPAAWYLRSLDKGGRKHKGARENLFSRSLQHMKFLRKCEQPGSKGGRSLRVRNTTS